MYKYDWIWRKNKAGNFQQAKVNPMKYHEVISVFYSRKPTFNLWNLRKLDKPILSSRKNKGGKLSHCSNGEDEYYQEYTGFHNSILEFSKDGEGKNSFHPTQKPVPLLEYLIKTYTNEGELVLDNCMGSGTTAIACLNTNRNFIGFEMDKGYFDIANERIEKHIIDLNQKLF